MKKQTDSPCAECGLNYVPGHGPDERYHKRFHDQAVNGVKANLQDGISVVSHRSPLPGQRLAAYAAREANRETHFDLPLFSACKKRFDEFNTATLLVVAKGRVVGLLVSRERPCGWTAEVGKFELDSDGRFRPMDTFAVEGRNRRTVDMIWVLKSHRRLGLAKKMIGYLAQLYGTTADQLAYLLPLQESAVRLLLSMGMDRIYVCR